MKRIVSLTVRICFAGLILSVAMVIMLRWISPPTTAFMVQEGFNRPDIEIAYEWVSLDKISSHLAISVVASEDQKFLEHYGFDFESINKALKERSKRVRGASTISQQVVKNLFLWPGRSYFRKGVEAYFTGLIEVFWSKRRILEVYLNIAEFGPGIFGASVASQRHFSKASKDLTSREAALLAAVLPSPKRMSAGRPSTYVQKRASEIQNEVRGLGGIDYLSKLYGG